LPVCLLGTFFLRFFSALLVGVYREGFRFWPEQSHQIRRSSFLFFFQFLGSGESFLFWSVIPPLGNEAELSPPFLRSNDFGGSRPHCLLVLNVSPNSFPYPPWPCPLTPPARQFFLIFPFGRVGVGWCCLTRLKKDQGPSTPVFSGPVQNSLILSTSETKNVPFLWPTLDAAPTRAPFPPFLSLKFLMVLNSPPFVPPQDL